MPLVRAFISLLAMLGQSVLCAATDGSSALNDSAPLTKAAKKLVTEPELTVGANGFGDWLMVGITLLGIVALIYALAWVAKRYGGLTSAGVHGMRIVAALPVGARERIVLLDVKGQQLLLGITSHSINHLHTFAEPVIEAPLAQPGEFAKKLQGMLNTVKSASHDRA